MLWVAGEMLAETYRQVRKERVSIVLTLFVITNTI